MALSNNLGFPSIGKHRELKKATEGYWAGKLSAEELHQVAATIREQNWYYQQDSGIDLVPSNDFSLYDRMLDMVALLGAVPERYHWDGETVDLDTYFAMARGAQRKGLDVTAMEMTKWFDTNYHYLVPELSPNQTFRLGSTKPFDEFAQARTHGITTKPVLIGPVSFLLLGKGYHHEEFDLLSLLDNLLPVYKEVIGRLGQMGSEWIQLDEPCFVQDRTDRDREALTHAYTELATATQPAQARRRAKLIVQTYFDHVGDNYRTLAGLPVQAIGLDLVRGSQNLDLIQRFGFPEDKALAAGVVNGRNVWITDLGIILDALISLAERVGPSRLIINPSSSLLHVPIDVGMEKELDPRLREWLAFAEQKIQEVVVLARGVNRSRQSEAPVLRVNEAALRRRQESDWVHRPEVVARTAAVGEEEANRGVPFDLRREAQRRELHLPSFPTTTIGSFPQTAEVRRNRNRLRKGEITEAEYQRYIEGEIRHLITYQEEMGLDVLVHGEFERSDMVEYFGELLDGMVTSRNGWVQSYGTRYVRPPIIYGDVSRPEPMTLRWSAFAQSLTDKPVKGMLTGPVTILNWSFVRDDQPRSETCKQIALALRDEVRDLESAGIKVIQVDEPALREGLPLQREDWAAYLEWAVLCYRLATGVASPATQIHSHMCYSHFDDIIESIAALDADVISMSNSRSDLELMDTFRRFRYRNEIGPGVYDIHSPRVPPAEEMRHNLEATGSLLDPDQLWVNPDCGLKTRRWEEVTPALQNMVQAAKELREALVPAGR